MGSEGLCYTKNVKITEKDLLVKLIKLYYHSIVNNPKIHYWIHGFQDYMYKNIISQKNICDFESDMAGCIAVIKGILASGIPSIETINGAILDNVDYSGSGNTAYYKNIFRDVISKMEYDDKMNLLDYWTGSFTTPDKIYLIIEEGEYRLPVARTCFNELRITTEFLNRQIDDIIEKMTDAVNQGLISGTTVK